MKAMPVALLSVFTATILTGCSTAQNTSVSPTKSVSVDDPTAQTKPKIAEAQFYNANQGWSTSQTGQQVFYTTDGGKQWTDASPKSIPNGISNYYFFYNSTTAWLLSENKAGLVNVYRTLDRGNHWSKMTTLKPEYPLGGIQVDFVDPIHGFIENTLPGMGPLSAVLYKTDNGGTTWNKVASTGASPGSQLPVGGNITFTNELNGWLNASPRSSLPQSGFLWLYRTNTDGKTWEHVNVPVSTQDQEDLLFLPATVSSFSPAGLAVPVSFQKNGRQVDTKLYLTTNNGFTWTVKNLPNAMFTRVDFINAKNGWIMTNTNELYRTTNGGHSWTLLKSNVEFDGWMPQFLNAQVGWAIVNGNLYWTKNGGENWTKEQGSLRP